MRKILSISILLLCPLLGLSAVSSAAELQVGKMQEGTVHDGKGPGYTLPLKAGDYVEAELNLGKTELVITIYDPAGSKCRAFRLDEDYGAQLRFVAEATGIYRLEVAGRKASETGKFSLTLSKVVPLEQRLAAAPGPNHYESTRIKQLNAEVKAGKQDAVARFWEEARAKGTPLLEPIAGDSRFMLATFLWQGDQTTKNVFVELFPYVLAWPVDYSMVRLGETDVWYKTIKMHRQTRCVYRLAANASYFNPGRDRDQVRTTMFFASGRTDPLNPRHWLHDPENPDNVNYTDFSVLELPDAPAQPWTKPRPGVPSGAAETHRFKSTMLNNERDLIIYLPAGYDKNARQPYGLIVFFDGYAYMAKGTEAPWIPGSTTLDNLIAEKRIPPVVGLFIDNPPGMRNPELACNLKFLDSLNSEMVPWVRKHYNVTRDAKNTLAGGLSFGGLSAACAALHHPETFGNVLAQSGGFAWSPPRSGEDLFARMRAYDPDD
ncbi:MAG TPA: alpha/beta hydrolase-fold protein, partial [Candidatus Limnocylindrales bacterium]|nr:alpha/beta hydrolase-fold protein [Candidatus Limnocylindrales bacterium]